MAHTYILRCADGSYYVGSTTNLERRIAEHNSDALGATYTRRRRPVLLVWAAEFNSIKDAFGFEKQVQGWSRAKREALIRGDLDHLPQLAARRTSSTERSLADLADDPPATKDGPTEVPRQPVVSRRLLAQPPQPPVDDDPWQSPAASP